MNMESHNRRFLAAILKTAKDDLDCIYSDKYADDFCDRSHYNICLSFGFRSGRDELREFFYSMWFDYICDELGYAPEFVFDSLGAEIINE